MDRADDVLTFGVIDHTVGEFFVEWRITPPCVSADQAYFLGNRAAHEAGKGCGIDAIDNTGDDLTLALYRADDWSFSRTNAASPATSSALADMPVLRLAAYESFVHFHNAHELAEVIVREASADTVAHVPSGAVGAEAHHAMNLKGADPFLTDQHQVNDSEPLPQWLIRVLEDRPGDMREAVVGSRWRTCVAEPVPFHRTVRLNIGIAAARADYELGPTMFGE